MKNILVTGINGFVGQHLARALVDYGFNVSGIIRETAVDPQINQLVKGFVTCDLTDPAQTNQLDLSSYDAVINLAGLANVAQSFHSPDLYMKVNVSVLANICQRIYDQHLKTRVLAISTGAVYDNSQPMPLSENSKLTNRTSPYAQSKIAMEEKAREFRRLGLDIVIARPFNHIGPGQARGFLVPDLIDQVRKVLANDQPIKAGNLKTRRDFTDVRDVVKAYTKLATSSLNFDTYNICSGKSVAGEQILKLIIVQLAPGEKLSIVVDDSLIRPTDPIEIFGSFARLESDTGWQPAVSLSETIAETVNSY